MMNPKTVSRRLIYETWRREQLNALSHVANKFMQHQQRNFNSNRDLSRSRHVIECVTINSHMPFLIGGLLKPSLYLQSVSRYLHFAFK